MSILGSTQSLNNIWKTLRIQLLSMSTKSSMVTWSSHAVPPYPAPAPALIVVYRIVSRTLHCYGMDAQKTMKCRSCKKPGHCCRPSAAEWPAAVTRAAAVNTCCTTTTPAQQYLAILISRHSDPELWTLATCCVGVKMLIVASISSISSWKWSF